MWQIRSTCMPNEPLTGFAHHAGDELGDDGAPLPHLALLAVGEVGEDACDALGAGGLARVHHDQHLHDGGVHISEGGGDDKHAGVRQSRDKPAASIKQGVSPSGDNSKFRTFLEARTFGLVLTHPRAI